MQRLIVAALVFPWLFVGPAVWAKDPPAATAAAKSSNAARQVKTVRLLTVGNSFSANATHYLRDLAKAGGQLLEHHPIVLPGASLADHWRKVEAYQKDPHDPRGTYGRQGGLKDLLERQRWDMVTIQQASRLSHDVNTYRPYAADLAGYIKRYAPQATLLVHETWEYRSDDPRFTTRSPKPGEPTSQLAMYQGLRSAYQTIAGELGARQIPVGDAFHLADSDSVWGYRIDTRFDRKSAQPPALPDQTHSLHVGWRWTKRKDGKQELTIDGHHANTAGEYLGACVFYEVLFGESVVDNPFVPEGLDHDYAQFLRQTAQRAVR